MTVPLDEKGLLPCPFCGAQANSHQIRARSVRFVCPDCEASGPIADGNPETEQVWDSARAAWNRRAYLAASPSPSMEKEVVDWDQLRDLIGEYFDLGYAEGVVQRDADTMAGDAQRTLTEIEGIISQAQSALASMRAERDEADNALVDKYRDPKTGHFNFPSDVAAIVRRLDTAEAQVQRLTEENEALRKERASLIETKREQIERLTNGLNAEGENHWKQRDRAEAAEARIKALEEALSPFAAITEVPALGYVTKEMVISARSALKENAL